MKIPDKLVQFYVFDSDNLMVGVADLTLPDLDYMSETVKGAGIGGEIDIPIIGSLKSMTTTITWRSLVEETAMFLEPKGHTFYAKGSVQEFDGDNHDYRQIPLKITERVIPKNFKMGKMDPGTSIGSSSDFEVLYLKLEIDGKTMYEIDKTNSIFRINGVDYLAAVRRTAGLGY